MTFPQFPPSFLFGTATAAFQIEGSPTADGKGRSIWDTFTHTPKKIRTGENADVACDTYLHPERDIELMTELNLNAYRFSKCFGLVHVDHNAQQRIVKDSGYWVRDMIRSQRT